MQRCFEVNRCASHCFILKATLRKLTNVTHFYAFLAHTIIAGSECDQNLRKYICPFLYLVIFSMQRREAGISSIFKGAQPDICIFLKLIWHHCFCSLVKGQRNRRAHKDRWRTNTFINTKRHRDAVCSSCREVSLS